MTQLDIAQAWKSASRLVGTNREVLAAIAGVFILLPSLALAFFVREPAIATGLAPREQLAILTDAYARAAPLMLPLSLVQMAGMLIVIVVMTDRARPTVAEAIRRGALATLPYFAAQLLIWLALGTVFMGLAALAGAIGNPAVSSALAMLMLALAATVGLRTALVAPVFACEDERNPLAALRRSWRLTHGSAWRLASFLLLAALLFMVILVLATLFTGVVLALTASREVQRLGAAIVSSVLTAGAMVYAAAILAAVHRQLAGPADAGVASTFD